MKFSNVLIHRNCGFCNLSLQSFSDAFPLFWRDFTLIMADKQQCFLVDGGVSNVPCTHRRVVQAVMHVCISAVVFVVFSRYPSEQENNVMCYVCSSHSAVKHPLKPWGVGATGGISIFRTIWGEIPSKAKDKNSSSAIMSKYGSGLSGWGMTC